MFSARHTVYVLKIHLISIELVHINKVFQMNASKQCPYEECSFNEKSCKTVLQQDPYQSM